MVSERGSVTIWSLGLVVSLLFLGGLSLDLWRVLNERRALAAMADAASVAGSSGIDSSHFRATGRSRLDIEAATRLATAHVAAQERAADLTGVAVTATTDAVTVRLATSVDLTLTRVLLDAHPVDIAVAATSSPALSP